MNSINGDHQQVVIITDFFMEISGWEPAKGLWGMKHTRKPVDNLVSKAKNLPENNILPRVLVEVTKKGLSCKEITKKSASSEPIFYGVNEISYGVQDVIYTRVFSMIIVTDKKLEEGMYEIN